MQKAEDNSIDLSPVKSSQIAKIGYDPETNTAAIQFHGKGDADGSVYYYDGVSQKEFDSLKGAESIGKAFGAGLKKSTKFRKIPAKAKFHHG